MEQRAWMEVAGRRGRGLGGRRLGGWVVRFQGGEAGA